MRSLFWKIFLWFWLAMATVVVTISAIVFVTQQQHFREREGMHGFNGGPPSRPEDRVVRQALSTHLQTAQHILLTEGITGLQSYLARQENQPYLHTFCFDAQGKLLEKSPSPNTGYDPALLNDLVRKAVLTSQLETTNSNQYLMAAQRASIGPSAEQAATQILVLAAAWNTQWDDVRFRDGFGGPDGPSRGRHHAPFGPPFGFLWDLLFGEPSTSIQILRVFVILLTTGLFCYGLVRHLTTPIFQLRAATKRLAAGDLSARVEPDLGHRRDELGVLGRDFDQMAERLEDLVAAQNRLIADISHELRSPLARVNVAVELVRATTGEEAKEDLDRIVLETERLNTMIGQLLTLSRLESGEPLSEKTPVNLSSLVQSIAADADFEARSKKRAVRITQSVGQSTADLQTCGSENLLRSAIENIVRNAVRYTQENSAVEISLQKEDEFAVIRVRDFGPGVPEAALPHLFQPFYRVTDARERTSGGTGLGLSIADRAVRFHGGTLQASNVAADDEIAGLLMEIRLPVND
jgi:two-component system sensor histidine kinase CpxA